MVNILKDILDKILEDSKASYPHECCGVLLGKNDGEKRVLEAYKLENINKERAKDRYEINPKELLKFEKEAGKSGLDILGFYHSHPDHPARPSEFDRERGWQEYSYIIVSVMAGNIADTKSWTFNEIDEPLGEETKAPFGEEEIKII